MHPSRRGFGKLGRKVRGKGRRGTEHERGVILLALDYIRGDTYMTSALGRGLGNFDLTGG